MYLPPHFRESRIEEAFAIIDAHPFATVIATSDPLEVNHLPLMASMDGEQLVLTGHMSKKNPQWKVFQRLPLAYAVFHGPHAYVSPTWYSEHDVPTWNYAVVHVTGSVALVERPLDLIRILSRMADRYEPKGESKWSFALPDDLKSEGALSAAIIGFELRVDRVDTKLKLSQNRSELDRAGVMKGLSDKGDEASRAVLSLMRHKVDR